MKKPLNLLTGFIRQKKNVIYSLLTLLFVSALTNAAYSQLLTTNSFTGASACPTAGNVFSTTANAAATPLSRQGVICTQTANVFNSTTLNNTASRNDNSYIEFSITATSGYALNLTALSFFRQGSNTAPNSLIVSYSTDAANFNATRIDLGTAITPTSGTSLTLTAPTAITTDKWWHGYVFASIRTALPAPTVVQPQPHQRVRFGSMT